MLSRWIARFVGISTICLALCAAASAQYGGGGGKVGSGGIAVGDVNRINLSARPRVVVGGTRRAPAHSQVEGARP